MSNSHIQIPLSVIKNFAFREIIKNGKNIYSSWFIFSITMGGWQIKKEKVKDYGAELDYYDDDVECLLNSKVETPFGNIKKRIYRVLKNIDNEIKITKQDYEIMIEYLNMLFYRNQKVFNAFNEVIPKHEKGDDFNRNTFVKTCCENGIKLFPNYELYSVTLLVTKSETHFINSFTGFCRLKSKTFNGNSIIFAPISPYGGILYFIPNSLGVKFEMQIADDETVIEINKYIYKEELRLSNKSLFAHDKKDLEMIKDYFLSHI